MQRVYISGPMTGMPDLNVKAFNNAAAVLRLHGHTAVNPVENGQPSDAEWHQHMRADIRMLMDCDAIYMLTGWMRSRGALLEHHIASELGMEIWGAHA